MTNDDNNGPKRSLLKQRSGAQTIENMYEIDGYIF